MPTQGAQHMRQQMECQQEIHAQSENLTVEYSHISSQYTPTLSLSLQSPVVTISITCFNYQLSLNFVITGFV
jgi:hypothetical protein